MDRVGVSFKSSLSADEVRALHPAVGRVALEATRAGFYANYLRQADADPAVPAEHLLVFHVRDFQASLRLLRMELERIGVPGEASFHNLDPSEPMY